MTKHLYKMNSKNFQDYLCPESKKYGSLVLIF